MVALGENLPLEVLMKYKVPWKISRRLYWSCNERGYVTGLRIVLARIEEIPLMDCFTMVEKKIFA